jgi:hypothetical protein
MTRLKYSIYNISGQWLDTGIVAPGNETSLSFSPGMYFVACRTETDENVVKVTTAY